MLYKIAKATERSRHGSAEPATPEYFLRSDLFSDARRPGEGFSSRIGSSVRQKSSKDRHRSAACLVSMSYLLVTANNPSIRRDSLYYRVNSSQFGYVMEMGQITGFPVSPRGEKQAILRVLSADQVSQKLTRGAFAFHSGNKFKNSWCVVVQRWETFPPASF